MKIEHEDGDVNVTINDPTMIPKLNGLKSNGNLSFSYPFSSMQYVSLTVNGNFYTSLIVTVLKCNCIVKGNIMACNSTPEDQYLILGKSCEIHGECIGFKMVITIDDSNDVT
jgi:hypothetical protein